MKLPRSPPCETRQRVYGEQRSLLGNYKTGLGKEEALRKVIGKDSEEGLVSGPFALEELHSKRPKVLPKFHRDGNQRSHQTRRQNIGRRNPSGRQPKNSSNNATNKTWSCGLPKGLRHSRKPGHRKMGRNVCAPSHLNAKTWTRSSLDNGTSGKFYANTVGTFGIVSACRNWGRLASAGQRWALKLVWKRKRTYCFFWRRNFPNGKKRYLAKFVF